MGSALMGSLQISCLFDRWILLVLSLTCLYHPKSVRSYVFPQSVKMCYFCSGPISVDPICPQPRQPTALSLRSGRLHVYYVSTYTHAVSSRPMLSYPHDSPSHHNNVKLVHTARFSFGANAVIQVLFYRLSFPIWRIGINAIRIEPNSKRAKLEMNQLEMSHVWLASRASLYLDRWHRKISICNRQVGTQKLRGAPGEGLSLQQAPVRRVTCFVCRRFVDSEDRFYAPPPPRGGGVQRCVCVCASQLTQIMVQSQSQK